MLHIEEVVEFSFAAVAAEEEDREEKEDGHSDEEVETSIAEGSVTTANDIDFEVLVIKPIPHLPEMFDDGVRVATDFADIWLDGDFFGHLFMDEVLISAACFGQCYIVHRL